MAGVDEVIPRNALREERARISDVGIFSVAKKLVPPAPEEGFDVRFAVRLTAQASS